MAHQSTLRRAFALAPAWLVLPSLLFVGDVHAEVSSSPPAAASAATPTTAATPDPAGELDGFEIVNVQGGVDWAVAPSCAAGFVASFALGRYRDPAVRTTEPGSALHEWLTAGLRLVFR